LEERLVQEEEALREQDETLCRLEAMLDELKRTRCRNVATRRQEKP
jgi:hypothetical protein